jgi:FAD binding domain
MIDRRPVAIVYAAGVADVMAALQFAGELGLPVAIRGGGHNVAGTSVGDDSIVVDLARFKSVRVEPVQRKARAGGGVLWGEYDCETQAFGLASPGGAISTTGIAGLTLGGGYGYVRILIDALPDTLSPAQKAEIVKALGVVFGLALHQGVAGPKGAVPVPNRINEGIASSGETNADVKANLGGSSHKCSSWAITQSEQASRIIRQRRPKKCHTMCNILVLRLIRKDLRDRGGGSSLERNVL